MLIVTYSVCSLQSLKDPLLFTYFRTVLNIDIDTMASGKFFTETRSASLSVNTRLLLIYLYFLICALKKSTILTPAISFTFVRKKNSSTRSYKGRILQNT